MRVQLLKFEGCPNVDAARAALHRALEEEVIDARVEEIDVGAPDAPAWARGWGSPTILIDGEDVAGQGPSEANACRLYAGGAPSIDVIRARLRGARVPGRPIEGRRIAVPLVGAVAAALAASACCILPAALAVLGMSGAGIATHFAPYRIMFLGATAIALAVGFWLAYRRPKDACGCDAPRSRRAARIGLWLTTVLTVGLAAYPRLGDGRAAAGTTDTRAKATLRLRVMGMDCAQCTGGIANRLKAVPGVVSATVDFASEMAVVAYDGRDRMKEDAIAAVEAAGFRAEVLP